MFNIKLILLVTLAVISSFELVKGQKDNVCQTKSCIDKADEILSKLDTNVDPCDSFYDFACGNFMKQELTPAEVTRSALDKVAKNITLSIIDFINDPIRNSDLSAIKKAKIVYRSCMNIESVEKRSETHLLKFIEEELGGWPLASGNLKENPKRSIELMNKLSEFRFQPLINIYVANNPRVNLKQIIRISQPQLLPPPIILSSEYKNTYNLMTKTLLKYLNIKLNPVVEKEIANIYDIGLQISMSQSNPAEARIDGFKNITLNELQKGIPNFPWKEFFMNGAFKSAGVTIDADERLIVENWDYLIKMADIFSGSNKKTMDNFLILNFINAVVIDYLAPKYLELKQAFIRMNMGSAALKPRDEYCAGNLDNMMSVAMSRLYVERTFDKNAKTKITQLSKNLIKTFKDNLNKITWMDTYSKLQAKLKIEKLTLKVAYPEKLFDDSYVNSFYKFDVEEDNFLKNGLKIARHMYLIELKKLKIIRDKNEWITSPIAVNPFNDREGNQIVIPAGIINTPFYDENLPNYINYGAIGSVIGHELTHGFDQLGRLFDKDGLFVPEGLWSPNTIQNFKSKTDCMVRQYSTYVDKQTNLKVDGSRTIDENIADNGGLKQAYDAYDKWANLNGEEKLLPKLQYNQRQLFFISVAQLWCTKMRTQMKSMLINTDVHSPPELRVLATAANSEYFAKEFNCRSDQYNNPPKKCTVW